MTSHAWRTGDIVLYHSDPNDQWYDRLIECATHSPYEHVGIAVVNPPFDPGCERAYDGVYVMQSDGPFPPTAHNRGGVICKTLQYEKNTRQRVDVRPVSGPQISDAFLSEFWQMTRPTTYDYNPCDWLRIGLDHICGRCSRCAPRRSTERMYCSAFATYFWVQTGALPPTTDWADVAPSDLATNVTLRSPYSLGRVQVAWDHTHNSV